MTAGDIANCWVVGGHRPPLQFHSDKCPEQPATKYPMLTGKMTC